MVVFNASDETATRSVLSLSGRRYVLHPVQAAGGNPIVRQSSYARASGTFTVPARTVAVFVAR